MREVELTIKLKYRQEDEGSKITAYRPICHVFLDGKPICLNSICVNVEGEEWPTVKITALEGIEKLSSLPGDYVKPYEQMQEALGSLFGVTLRLPPP